MNSIIVNKIFSFFWKKRLTVGRWRNKPATVVKVKGWRTALVDDSGHGRMTETYMIWIPFIKRWI